MRDAVTATVAMCLFALFALRPLPLFLVSLAGLLVVAALIARSIEKQASLALVFGWIPYSPRVGRWTGIACVFGLALGLCYRAAYGLSLFPDSLTHFVVPAALIGATEEVIYRGYVQGRIGGAGFLFAPAFAALSHTAYKCALFVFPPEGVSIQISLLASLTFAAGFVLGLLRQVSGSVLPPVAAHALFDVLAYGDRLAAPWWIWR